MKRQPTDWEKIFVNDENSKGLISKIYKQLIYSTTTTTTKTQLKNGQKTKTHFSKEDIQMAG